MNFGNGYTGMSATAMMMYQRQQKGQEKPSASETTRTRTPRSPNANPAPFAPTHFDDIPHPPPTSRDPMSLLQTRYSVSSHMLPQYQYSGSRADGAPPMRFNGMYPYQQINGGSIYHNGGNQKIPLDQNSSIASSMYSNAFRGTNGQNNFTSEIAGGGKAPANNETTRNNLNQSQFTSPSESNEYIRLHKDHPLAIMYTQMQQQQQDRELQQLAILQQYQKQQLPRFDGPNHAIGDISPQLSNFVTQSGYKIPESIMQQHRNVQAMQQQQRQFQSQEQFQKKMMGYAAGLKPSPTNHNLNQPDKANSMLNSDNDALYCVEALLQFRGTEKEKSPEDHGSDDDRAGLGHKKKDKRYDACKVWNELPNPNHEIPEEIVDPSDHEYGATAFSYEVMAAMISCTFKKNDSRGKRINLPIGFPGLCCRYCLGGKEAEQSVTKTGRFFPASIKTMADTAKSLMAIYRHLIKCEECPDIVKQRMERFKGTHEHERRRRAYGSQKQFYTRIWYRLHGRLPPGGSKTLDKKFPFLEDGDPALLRHDKFSKLKCMSEAVCPSPSNTEEHQETSDSMGNLVDDSSAIIQSNATNDGHDQNLKLNPAINRHGSVGIIASENVSDDNSTIKHTTTV